MNEPNATVHDVICHMDIDIKDAAGRSDYDGRTYYFCALGCKADFDADPDGTLAAEAAYDHDQPMDHGMMAPATAADIATAEGHPKWQFWRR